MVGFNSAIDSLRVRIPLDEVEILRDDLTSRVLKIRENTGEVLGELKNDGIAIKDKGVSTYYGIQNVKKGGLDNKATVRCLVILFNSKLLQDGYFNGITTDTIETIYYRLLSHKVVKFSLESFKSAQCTDVDFKKDMRMLNFDECIKAAVGQTQPSKERNHGYRVMNNADNRGIEWCTRPHGTPSKPFYKVYDKMRELLNNSREFYDTYLKDVHDISDLIRIEGTVKNRKHFKRYGITDTSLGNLASLKEDEIEMIFADMFSCHLERRIEDVKPREGMTPEHTIYLNAINGLISQNWSFGEIEELLLRGIKSRMTKGRKKRLFKELYKVYVEGTPQDETSKQVNDFFRFMGMMVKDPDPTL